MPDDIRLADDLIWGANGISEEIFGDDTSENVRKTFGLLEKKHVPARKIGERWVASRRELRKHFHGEEPA